MRAYYFTARTGSPLASSLSTIFVERVYDVFSLGLLLLLALAWGVRGVVPSKAELALLFVALICVGTAVIAGALTRHHLRAKDSRPLGFIMAGIREFARPLSQLRDGRTALILATLSVAAWFSNYLSLMVLLRGVANSLPEAALLLLLFVNMGLLIPSSPGALGVMQAAFWLALLPFGVSKEQSLALSLAYQGGLYLFTLAVGLPFFLLYRSEQPAPAPPTEQGC
ncbi:hypothetical protein Adeg_0513 [Ammonifex degensii KC4]|uniref:Phosphatidylglycerol lysyltransferase n=2 Tax=Ammonifex degensii TaxID=42838 RepID=C9RBN6_AMMDK|nr:hypothetical protein Adeg_0513 [Ammonifex degensii KC4]